MKNSILISVTLLLLSACKNNNSCNYLHTENQLLKSKVDSLESWINNSFDPIILENNKSKVLYAGDTANFVVGLLMNDERIIDSIEISLFKLKNSDNMEFLGRNVAIPQLNKETTYGVEYFSLPNLSQGNYLYQGNIIVQGKTIPIEHYFNVHKR